jgi:hypothetical protein
MITRLATAPTGGGFAAAAPLAPTRGGFATPRARRAVT